MSAPDFSTLTPQEIEVIAKAALSGNRGLSFGPIILALVFISFLHGVSVVKFVDWASSSGKDRLFNRLIAYWVLFVATVTFIFTICWVMVLFAYDYGTDAQFFSVKWVQWLPFLDLFIDIPIQVFFAERAYRVMRNSKIFLLIIVPLILACFGTNLGYSIAFHSINNVPDMTKLGKWIYTTEAIAMAVDLVNTGVLAYGLLHSRTGWSATDRIIKKIVRFTIEAQLTPSLVAISSMIQYSIAPSSNVGVFHQILLPFAYLTAFTLVLNSRETFRRDMANASSNENNTFLQKSNRPTQATVHVNTETYAESYEIETRKLGLNRDPSYDPEKSQTLTENSVADSGIAYDLHKQTSTVGLRDQVA